MEDAYSRHYTGPESIDEVEVLEGNTFDFGKLDQVEYGMITQAILDMVEVVNYNINDGDDEWDKVV